MRIIVLAQNVPYLVSIGVPEDNAQAILDHLNTVDKKNRGIVLKQIKNNPTISLDELKQFKIFTQEEKEKVKEEKYSDTPKDLLDWAKSISPSYIDWLIKQVKNESIRPTEDDDVVKADLKKFDYLKRKKDLPKENRDINHYKTYNSLSETLSYLTAESEDAESSEPKIPNDDPDIIYNQDGLKILKINDFEKVRTLTANVGDGPDKLVWCTGRGTRYEPPLYLFTLNGYRIALMHPSTQQIKGRLDEALQDYQTVKLLAEPMKQLGILPPTNSTGDFAKFNLSLKHGSEIQDAVSKSDNKKETLVQLQSKKEEETKQYGYFEEKFGRGFYSLNVALFLNEQDFEDPGVQEYCIDLYNKWITHSMSAPDFFAAYKKLPLGMRLIPEIRDINKSQCVDILELTKNTEQDANPYLSMGRELKVLPEIQKAYKTFWSIKVKQDPEKYYNSPNIPEQFKKEFKQLYVDAIIDKIKEGPSHAGGGNISWPAYKNAPDDIKALPVIAEAIIEGWKNFAYTYPEQFHVVPPEYQNQPEFIQKNDDGWMRLLKNTEAKSIGKMYAKIPERIKMLPEYATIKSEKVIPYYQAVIRKDVTFFDRLQEDIKSDPNVIKAVERIALPLLKDNPQAYFNLPDSIRNLPRIKQIEQKAYLPLWIQQAKTDTNLFNSLPPSIQNIPAMKEANIEAWKERLKNTPDLSPFYRTLPEHVKNSPYFRDDIEKKVVPIYLAEIAKHNLRWERIPVELFAFPAFLRGCKEILFNNLQKEDAYQLRNYYQLLPEVIRADEEVQAAIKAKLSGQPIKPLSPLKPQLKPKNEKRTPKPTNPIVNQQTTPTIPRTNPVEETVEASSWYQSFKISQNIQKAYKGLKEQVLELDRELEDLDKKEHNE